MSMYTSPRACSIAFSTILVHACVPDGGSERDGRTHQLTIDCFVSICETAAASSPDRPLVKALLNAAGTTNCTAAAQRLLDIDEIPYALRRSHITSLRALGCFSHFTRLNLYSNDIVDLSPLSGMHELQSLSLASNPDVETIAPLAGLPKLSKLFLRYTAVRDLDRLDTSRATLRLLDVSGTTEVTGEQIARFGELRTLVAQRRQIVGSTLARLSKLTTLDLFDTQLLELQPGSFPASLKKLDLSFSNMTNAALLAPLRRLVALDASYTDMTGWAALSELTKMKQFTAARTRIGEDGGLGFIAPWNDLELIDVTETGITDAQALAGKHHLLSANFRLNGLASPPDVSSSPELESLFLDDNVLHDVSSLVGLTWVPTIYIGHNPVTVGLCDLARPRVGRPQTLPQYQDSPGYDHAIIDAIAACPDLPTPLATGARAWRGDTRLVGGDDPDASDDSDWIE